MIIDFHAHAFEDEKAPRIIRDMEARGISSCGDGTVAGLLASMEEAGIGLSVVSRITTKPEQAPRVNEWLLGLQRPSLVPAATIHPWTPHAADEVEELWGRGFQGFKLHPDYQGFFIDEERLFPFFEAAEARGLWVLVHAGLDRGLPGVPVHASPERLLRVHEAFPRLRLIAAHMGGEEIYEETERHLLGRDVYLDTSFVLRKMPREALKRLTDGHSKERLLFGTDSPWSHQGEDLRFLLSLPFLKDGEKEKITYWNAAELLGLGRDGGAG